MCLTTKQLVPEFTRDQLLKLAQQISSSDIVCYKRFKKGRTNLYTPHQGVPWTNTINPVTVPSFGVVHRGAKLDINQGLHAYTNKEIALLHARGRGNQTVRKMIIPAKTPYIINEDGTEIVSLAMRLAKPETNARPKRKLAKASKRKVASKRKKK